MSATDKDLLIEAFKRDIDRTLFRANLRLTVEQRILKLQEMNVFADELRRAGKNAWPKQ